jgi:ATP-dependent DNA ligase
MFKAFDCCLPTRSTIVPTGADWLHEIKYDGYRLRVERDGDRVRLITRGGYDWTKRFPWIVEAALKNRQKRFVIDGEAVTLGVDGISDFDALHSGRHNEEVQMCAFDVMAIDGDDLRKLPLSMRKTNLERPAGAPTQRHLHLIRSSAARSALISSAPPSGSHHHDQCRQYRAHDHENADDLPSPFFMT